jgi:alkylation response protein AidB-like acyl-CoA dehydrogenase
MNLDLTPLERAFRDEVATWLQDNVPRDPQPYDGLEMRDFDLAWQRCQYDGGWAGIAWPQAYGGRGLSAVEQLIWFEESALAGAPEARATFVGLNHGGPTLIANATEAQKAFHLPKILRGEVVWCQGFSEPEAGSDLANLSTRAEIDGDELVVSGSKLWTSYAHLADYQELLVRTDPNSRKHGGITWVICDMRSPGITVRPVPFVTGEHHFNQVFYDNVRIPIGNVVGEMDHGWAVAMSTLSFERGTAFTQFQVILAKAVDGLIDRARTRTGPGGRAEFADSDIGRRLIVLRAETAALRAMTYLAVARNQRRPAPGPDGSMLKILLGRLGQQAERIGVELLGPDVVVLGDATLDYLRGFQDTVAGGTDEIQHNIVAQRVLNLPRQH